MTDSIWLQKRYEFANAHFIQCGGQLSVLDGDIAIQFVQMRDGRRLVPTQRCFASTIISKPRDLVDFAVRSLVANMSAPTQPTPIGDFPEPIGRAVRDIEERLNKRAIEIAKSLRWRCNAHGTTNVLKTETAPFTWSLDGITWLPVYGRFSIEHLEWQFEILDHVIDPDGGLYVDPGPEPLAFELLMEARELQYDNPRSAIVIAVAAAEVGTKRCLQYVEPNLGAVLEADDCPPMLDLLDQYYPKGSVIRIVPSIIAELRKVVYERNRLVHAGEFTLKRDQIRRRLSAIEDLLRIFDIQMGHAWAEKFLSTSVRKDLDLPLLPMP